MDNTTMAFGKRIQDATFSLLSSILQKSSFPKYKSLTIDMDAHEGLTKFRVFTQCDDAKDNVVSFYEVPLMDGSVTLYDAPDKKYHTSYAFDSFKPDFSKFIYEVLANIDEFYPNQLDRCVILIKPDEANLNAVASMSYKNKTIVKFKMAKIDKLYSSYNKQYPEDVLKIVNELLDVQDKLNFVDAQLTLNKDWLSDNNPAKTKFPSTLGSVSIIESVKHDIDLDKAFKEHPELAASKENYTSRWETPSCNIYVQNSDNKDKPSLFVNDKDGVSGDIVDELIHYQIDSKNLKARKGELTRELTDKQLNLTIVTKKGKVVTYMKTGSTFHQNDFIESHPEIDWSSYPKVTNSSYARINLNKISKQMLDN